MTYRGSRYSSQEVCPFTRRFSTTSSEAAFAARGAGEPPFGVQLEAGAARSHPATASPSLIALLETALDEAAWDAFSRGSAVRRSGRAGFARNVCVGLGNWGSPDAVPVLARARPEHHRGRREAELTSARTIRPPLLT
jgi:epoxyqueuosine reductase QueG